MPLGGLEYRRQELYWRIVFSQRSGKSLLPSFCVQEEAAALFMNLSESQYVSSGTSSIQYLLPISSCPSIELYSSGILQITKLAFTLSSPGFFSIRLIFFHPRKLIIYDYLLVSTQTRTFIEKNKFET